MTAARRAALTAQLADVFAPFVIRGQLSEHTAAHLIERIINAMDRKQ